MGWLWVLVGMAWFVGVGVVFRYTWRRLWSAAKWLARTTYNAVKRER